MKSDWILADVHLEGLPTPDTQLGTWWHHEGVIAVFPISSGRYRVIADVGHSEGAHPLDPTLQQVQAIVDRRGPGGISLHDPLWLAGFRINERKVRDYRKGRVFLAGDAAHVHSPAGGQGMNTGMQDAFNLAWKLALVCRREARAEPLLGSYSPERSAVGDKVLADAGRLTVLATLRNPIAAALRNAVCGLLFGLPVVNEAMAQNFSETTLGYADSPLNGCHVRGVHGPAPGQRLPPRAGRPPIGAGAAPRFTLLAQAGVAVDALRAAHGGLLAAETPPPPDAGALWLVRPDGYVAAVAREAAPLAQYLEALQPAH